MCPVPTPISVTTFSKYVKHCTEVVMGIYKSETATFIFRVEDLDDLTDYGEPVKSFIEIETTVNISPVRNTKGWGIDGIVSDSEMLLMVSSLTKDGINYLTREYFSDDRIDNIFIKIGDITYRVDEIRSPESIHDEIPYWVVSIKKLEGYSF